MASFRVFGVSLQIQFSRFAVRIFVANNLTKQYLILNNRVLVNAVKPRLFCLSRSLRPCPPSHLIISMLLLRIQKRDKSASVVLYFCENLEL